MDKIDWYFATFITLAAGIAVGLFANDIATGFPTRWSVILWPIGMVLQTIHLVVEKSRHG